MKKFTRANCYYITWAAAIILFASNQLFANTYTVTSPTDHPITGSGISVNSSNGLISGGAGNGLVTIRSAIAAANSIAGPHTINIPAGTYSLTIAGTGEGLSPAVIGIGDLDVTANNVTIHGAGMNSTIINQTSGIDRVFDVNVTFIPNFNFTIDNLTISGGREQTGNGGGGMFTGSSNNLGTISLTNVKFDNNQSFQVEGFNGSGFGGGGLQHQGGDLILSGCVFNNNSASKSGGGLSAFGFRNLPIAPPIVVNTVTITNCIFTSNQCSGASGGGAIDVFAFNLGAPNVTISGCSFSSNVSTASSGGAISNESSNSMIVEKSTFLNNTAFSGGGVFVGGGGGSTIQFCRFIGNTATSTNGNGVFVTSSTLDANNNWWGVNTTPVGAFAGSGGTGVLALTKWLQLKHTASPTSLVVSPPGSSTLTASFLTNSANEAISTSNLTQIIGLPITFNNAIQGTLSGAQTTIQSSGTATATYTVLATACPPSGSADAKVDNATTTATITVIDNIPPVITCPQNIEVSNTPGQCGASPAFAATATDNCTNPPTIRYYLNFGAGNQTEITSPRFFPVGTTTVTAVATDASNNNSIPCSFTVKVNDVEAPVISGCPGTVTVQTGPGNLNCSQTASWTEPTSNDNCDGPVAYFSRSHAPGSTFPVGTTQVTYVFKDSKGNSNSCQFNVVVQDNTVPVVNNCPSSPITVQTGPNNLNCSQTASWTEPTATDNCSGALTYFSRSHAPGSTFNVGTTPVTYVFKDLVGNQSTCSFNVVVVDNTPPVVTCSQDIEVNNTTGLCSASVTFNASASDNCSTPTKKYYLHYGTENQAEITSPHIFPGGTTQVTVIATDAVNNSSSCTFNVKVNDVEAPVISGCPNIVTVQTGPGNLNCSQTASWTEPTANDNCDGPVAYFSRSHAPGSTFPVGTTQVTYVFKDSKGNSNSCQFNVVVQDNTVPVVNNCPASPITVQTGPNNPNCSQTASWTEPTATDNCNGPLSYFSRSHAPGSTFDSGTTQVTYVFKDAAGNQSSCSFDVTVHDNTPPVITCSNNISVTEKPGRSGSASVSFTIGATDNCSSTTVTAKEGETEITSPHVFTTGTHTINVTAIDQAENQSTCSFTITVSPCVASTPTEFTDEACESYTLPWGDVVTSSGDYHHTYDNVDGCDSLVTAHITINHNSIVVTASTTSASSCADDGTIKLLKTGGVTPFTYSLNGDNFGTSRDFSGLASGNYTGYVKDSKGCVNSLSGIVVGKAADIVVTAIKSNASSCESDGSITLKRTGGIAPFTFSIDGTNFTSTNIFANLGVSIYTGYVRDGRGCTGSLSGITIDQTAAIAVSATTVNATSCNENGSITLTKTGGASPFTFSIDGIDFRNSNLFTELTSGTYTGYVKDGKGCVGILENIMVGKVPDIVVTASVANTSCVNDGSITLKRTGGTASFTYSIDGVNFGSSNVFTLLAPGIYTGYVKDAKNCIGSLENISVGKIADIIVSASTVSAAACFNDGSITLKRTGGMAPFSYSLDGTTFTSINVFSSLPAATYTGYVKDGKGCIGSLENISVGKVASIAVTASVVSAATCLDDGTITLKRTGGTGPFTYSLDGENFVTSNKFTGLAAASYNGFVTDAKGCTGSLTNITIGKAAPLTVTAKKTNVSCTGGTDGTITVTRKGGTSPVLYSLKVGETVVQPGQVSNTFPNLPADIYTVIVTDARNCSSSTNVTVTDGIVVCNPIASAPNNNQLVNPKFKGTNNLTIKALPNPTATEFKLFIESNSNEKAEIVVTDMYGKKLYRATGSAKQKYTFGEAFPSGTYIVQVIQGENIKTIKVVKGK